MFWRQFVEGSTLKNRGSNISSVCSLREGGYTSAAKFT